MGRYFNDDMTEDQNDDYDAYLEHYGIPKEKRDATVRARFDQLHHKAKDGYKSISDGAKKFGSKASKQIEKTIKKTGNKIAKAAEKAGIYKPQKTYYVDDDGKKTLLSGGQDLSRRRRKH